MAHLGNPGITQEMFRASESHDAREPLKLGLERAFSERRDSIVAATLIVVGGATALRRLFDQR